MSALEGPGPRLSKLGRYELITQIGSGGMAEVQLALQRGPAGFEKLVVVKLVHQKLAEQSTFVDMLLEEARMAALVKHPNVVDIYDLGEADGRYFIAMEYLEGEPLLALLRAGRDGKRLDPLSTARLVAGTAEGLDAAHELRNLAGDHIELVHHDVSLGNIVVLYNGQVKLVDFGVAKASQNAGPQMKVQGKFSYMAPEKLRGRGGDRRSDIWSLGCVLWESLTLRRLFKGSNDADTVKQVLENQIRLPSSVNGDVPEDFDPIVMKALDRDPSKRYGTAKEMAQDIEEVLRLHAYGGRNDVIARYMQTTFEEHINARKKLLQEVSSKGRASDDILQAAFSGATVMDAPAYSEERYRRQTLDTPHGTPVRRSQQMRVPEAPRVGQQRISQQMVAEGTPVEMPEDAGLELTLQPLSFEEPPPARFPAAVPVTQPDLFAADPAFGGDTQPRGRARLTSEMFAESMPIGNDTASNPIIISDPPPPPRLARDSNPLGIGEPATDPGERGRFAEPSTPGMRTDGLGLKLRDSSSGARQMPDGVPRSIRDSASGVRSVPQDRSSGTRSARESQPAFRGREPSRPNPLRDSATERAPLPGLQGLRDTSEPHSSMPTVKLPSEESGGVRMRESQTLPPRTRESQTLPPRSQSQTLPPRTTRDGSTPPPMRESQSMRSSQTIPPRRESQSMAVPRRESQQMAVPTMRESQSISGPIVGRGTRDLETPAPGVGIAKIQSTPAIREDAASLADMVNEPVVDLAAALDDEAIREISIARSESLGRAIGDVLDRFGEGEVVATGPARPRATAVTTPPPVVAGIPVAPRTHEPSKPPIMTPKLTIKPKQTKVQDVPVVVVKTGLPKFLPYLIGALVGIIAVVAILMLSK